jgi:DNA-binding MarR family transcriptional regulator
VVELSRQDEARRGTRAASDPEHRAAGGAEPGTVAAPAASAEARAAVHALTRASRILERSLPELSVADFRVLSAVAEGEARASRLATRLALGKPAISSTVDSLVRRGMLHRRVHGTDQRAIELALTPSGEAAQQAAESALAAVVAGLVASTEHPDAVLTALGELGDGIELRQASLAAGAQAARRSAVDSAARQSAVDSAARRSMIDRPASTKKKGGAAE